MPPDEEELAKTKAMVTAQGSELTSSVYRVLLNGSPTETDQIIGGLLVQARQANIPAPLLALAYTHLALYENRRTAGKN